MDGQYGVYPTSLRLVQGRLVSFRVADDQLLLDCLSEASLQRGHAQVVLDLLNQQHCRSLSLSCFWLVRCAGDTHQKELSSAVKHTAIDKERLSLSCQHFCEEAEPLIRLLEALPDGDQEHLDAALSRHEVFVGQLKLCVGGGVLAFACEVRWYVGERRV